jgi:hypothetical protein
LNELAGMQGACTLVTASCTTSWFDWIHGELWLCPEGLLRCSLGLLATGRHGMRPTVNQGMRETRSFTTQEIATILASDRRNRWIPWNAVSHATLKHGFVDSSLHLQLDDGRREKFLWLRIDGGYELLLEALEQRLPGSFEAIDKPFPP